MKVFLALRPQFIKLRTYTQRCQVSETTIIGNALLAEAGKLANALGLPAPTECNLAAGFNRLVFECFVVVPTKPNTHQITSFAKYKSWTISKS